MKGLNEAQRIYDRRLPSDKQFSARDDDHLREQPMRGDPDKTIVTTKFIDIDAVERAQRENQARYAASRQAKQRK